MRAQPIESLLAQLRGWYPHWRAELRVYVADETLQWAVVLIAALITFALWRRCGVTSR